MAKLTKQNTVILFDCGHGYDTKGKMSPILDKLMKIWYEFVDNNRFKEWKYTRVIGKDLVAMFTANGYDARLVVTEDRDISLKERVNRVNKICKEVGAGNVILISIHANAVGNATAWMNGQGWEAYTTPGVTKSDKLAECLYKRAEQNFKGRKIRKDLSDGDSDKEANFYIIKYSNCPAVLTENFFYDNKDDLTYMTSDVGHHAVLRTHYEGIIDYMNQSN